jgi:cytochrome b
MTTGEFRATPDISASTAQFQAFASQQGEQTRQWAMETPARSRTRLGILILGVVVVVAIIAILAVTLS